MNEQPLTRNERIASLIMKLLSVVGLVAVLALAAWLIVQGVRVLPRAGEGLGAAVSTVTSIFRSAPTSVIAFTTDTSTYASGESMNLVWNYTGTIENPEFSFTYTCAEGITLSLLADYGLSDLACNEPFITRDRSLTIIPIAKMFRFNEFWVSVSVDNQTDTKLITVVNSDIASTIPVLDKTEEQTENVSATPSLTPPVSAPVAQTQTVVLPPVMPSTPADLALTIVSLEQASNDRTATAIFTVKNIGGILSGPWGFVTYLPLDVGDEYRYPSEDVQSGLAPGQETTFTLKFGDLIDEDYGTIKIELVTPDDDPASNNTATERLDIR